MENRQEKDGIYGAASLPAGAVACQPVIVPSSPGNILTVTSPIAPPVRRYETERRLALRSTVVEEAGGVDASARGSFLSSFSVVTDNRL